MANALRSFVCLFGFSQKGLLSYPEGGIMNKIQSLLGLFSASILGLMFITSPVIAASAPKPPTLFSPSNSLKDVPQEDVYFSWTNKNTSGATSSNSYLNQEPATDNEIQISREKSFACKDYMDPCFNTSTGSATNVTKSMVNYGQNYFWRVRSQINGQWTNWSQVRSFTTKYPQFSDFQHVDEPAYDKNPNNRGWCRPQCVEFVRTNLGLDNGRTFAKDYWTNPHTNRGYINYPQGSSRVPQPGDILVWAGSLNPNTIWDPIAKKYVCDSNGCGHVAIVKSVNLKTGKLTIVDANRGGKCKIDTATMTIKRNLNDGYNLNTYTLSGFKDAHLLGWQSNKSDPIQ